MAIDPRIAT